MGGVETSIPKTLRGIILWKPESVRDVLPLMHSCDMYDYSGQLAFKLHACYCFVKI